MMDRAVTVLLFLLFGFAVVVLAVRVADVARADRPRLPCAERCASWGMRRHEVQYVELAHTYHAPRWAIVCTCRER